MVVLLLLRVRRLVVADGGGGGGDGDGGDVIVDVMHAFILFTFGSFMNMFALYL